jgi:hypothetical protein
MENEPRTNHERLCSANNRHGSPCGKRAVVDGLCLVHAGKQNMAELGKLGGRGRTRSVLGISDAVADDKLRAQAKTALEEALNSDNEQVRLRAAQSLYSYRSQEAPREPATAPEHPERGVFGIADLAAMAAELKVFNQSGGMTESAEQELVARLKERQAGEQAEAAGADGGVPRPGKNRARRDSCDSSARQTLKPEGEVA